MTIIEDAVKRLEQARRESRAARPELKPVGRLVDREATEAEPANGHLREDEPKATAPEPMPEIAPVPDEPRGVTLAEPRDPKPIVVIDRNALREAGLLAPEAEEGRLVDEFRHIKRPIVAHAFGKRATKIQDGRLIMVGSAVSGEGKTFTCINLALSMAKEQDLSVVLVDADVAKPHISRMFGLADEPGLLDALDNPDAYDYKDLVFETDVPGLGILPAGKPRAHATELLSSDRMELLLKAYRRDNIQRLVLFDSPPLLQTPEARVLASLVGQIAIVVKAGVTPQHVVTNAIGMIDENKAINLILNQSRQASAGGYYGYGYGYGYGNRGSGNSGDRSA